MKTNGAGGSARGFLGGAERQPRIVPLVVLLLVLASGCGDSDEGVVAGGRQTDPTGQPGQTTAGNPSAPRTDAAGNPIDPALPPITDASGRPVLTSRPVPPTDARGRAITTTRPKKNLSPPGGGVALSQAESPLKRKDVKPGDVANQVRLGSVLSQGTCGFNLGTGLGVTVEGGRRHYVGDMFRICPYGFFGGGDVAISVTSPDGRRRTEDVSGGSGSMRWTVEIGDPLGQYDVAARQGTVVVTNTFTVERPPRPLVIERPPREGRPGTVFEAGLAGFASNSRVTMDLWERTGTGPDFLPSSYSFKAFLPEAVTDERGEVIYRLTTYADDPPGTYCINARVSSDPPPICARFTVTG